MRIVAALLALVASGCTVLPDGDVPREGAPDGAQTMDASLRDGDTSDASADAGEDAEPSDAEPADGGPADAGPADGGPADGGPADAGTGSDAGPDAGPGCTDVYYADCDGDTYGAGEAMITCAVPPLSDLPSGCVGTARSWAERDGDCNDFDPDRNPDETEACDDVDSDCDGVPDTVGAVCRLGTQCVEGQGCLTTCPPTTFQVCPSQGCVRLDSLRNCGSCGGACLFGCSTDLACETLSALTAGGNRTCGWTDSGDLSCWGAAPFGAEPGAALEPAVVRLTLPASGSIVDMDVGPTHQCVLHQPSGAVPVELYCWGSTVFGQLGSLSPVVVTAPRLMDLGEVGTPTSVEVGPGFTCISNTADQVWCWGRDVRGTPVPSADPFEVSELTDAAVLVAGVNFLCIQDESDRVRCVGEDPGSASSAAFVGTATVASGASMLTAGGRHLCWLESGTLTRIYCQGDNALGQVNPDTGRLTRYTSPWQVGAGGAIGDPIALVAGANHTCLLFEAAGDTYRVSCWGANAAGQSGPGADPRRLTESYTLPRGPVRGGLGLGSAHSCVLMADGGRACWGLSTQGQFGWLSTIGDTPVGGSTPERHPF